MTKRGTSRAAAKERKILFVDAYLANGENATQAAIAVGFPECSARTRGSELVADRDVQAMIEKRRQAIRVKFGLTADRVWLEVGRVAYFNPKNLLDKEGNLIPLHKLDDDVAAALGSIEMTETDKDGVTREIKVKPHSKIAALDHASKMLKLYDQPPPPPDNPLGGLNPVVLKDAGKRILFLLHAGAAKKERDERPPVQIIRKKLKLDA